jgi:hypothetical protein
VHESDQAMRGDLRRRGYTLERRRVLVSGCLAAVTTALLVWVERDGEPELPGLVEQASSSLRSEVAAP